MHAYDKQLSRVTLIILSLLPTRNNYFVASSMEELFKTVGIRNVLDYVNKTHFYNKL